MKRRIDRLLSEGNGRQLLWLMLLSLACLFIAIFTTYFVFDDGLLGWQDVVAVFLDPGCFGGAGAHDWFRLTLALLSVFLFSALLVSVFTNVFENISESVRSGKRRYKLENHTIIIGASRNLGGMLDTLKDDKGPIVVMSPNRPECKGDYIYYCGSRDSEEDLSTIDAQHAKTIYIIGEDNEPEHDPRSLRCLNILKRLTANATHEIHCFMLLHNRVNSEIYEYLKQTNGGPLLLVDVINDYEYQSELLMVNTDFLPVIKSGETRRSHIVIFGCNHVAQNVAYTAAHISHYPNYTECGAKTCITFVASGIKRTMDNMLAARPGLFDLSVYRYIDGDGNIVEHYPEKDFLDIEWEWVDTYDSSSLARTMLENINRNTNEVLTIVIAEEDPIMASATALHLPHEVYDSNIAVYLEEEPDIIELSRATGMYGNIRIFGVASGIMGDPLFKHRSLRGQRVNYVYDKAYGNPPSPSAEVAWYKIPEAHKYSSIYCAMAMPLRRLCFDMSGDRSPIYEAEHRRWMMSVLLMGYSAGEKTDKKRFIHADILPYDELTPEEQVKDKILIDAMDDILKE